MRYRAFVIPAIGLALVLGGFLIFGSLGESLVYFRTPTEMGVEPPGDNRLRLGGQVVEGSVVADEATVAFTVTDGAESVDVIHRGAPQQLFQEGIGIVVEGSWDGHRFHSDTMIIKHDEQYRSRQDGAYETPRAP